MTENAEPRYPVRLVISRTGLTADVLRAWERRYGAVRPRRTGGKHRLYSEADIERLTLMRRLTGEGHSIAEIARLSAQALEALLESPPPAAAPDDMVDAIVVQAMLAAERMDASGIEEPLRRAALVHGAEMLIDRVIPALLRLVGKRWHDGSLSVAQEHHATAAVRRVIDWTTAALAARPGAPVVVVATPPGELHEVGALLAAAAAMAEGWRVVYLGANVPAPVLVDAVTAVAARALALSMVFGAGRSEREGVSFAARALRGRAVVLVGGSAAQQQRAALKKSGARFVPDFPAFRRALRGLRASERAEGPATLS